MDVVTVMVGVVLVKVSTKMATVVAVEWACRRSASAAMAEWDAAAAAGKQPQKP